MSKKFKFIQNQVLYLPNATGSCVLKSFGGYVGVDGKLKGGYLHSKSDDEKTGRPGLCGGNILLGGTSFISVQTKIELLIFISQKHTVYKKKNYLYN